MKWSQPYILVPGLMLILVYSAKAQQISSLSIIPNDPIGENTMVSVVAEAWHPSSGCLLVNTEIVQSQDTVFVYATHELGAALAICESRDTIALGNYEEGIYTVTYVMSSGIVDDIQITDTAHTSFSVQGLNFIDEQTKSGFQVFPNPANDIIFVKSKWKGKIELYDIIGKQILSQHSSGNLTTIQLHHLPRGMYVLLYQTDEWSESSVLSVY